VAAPDTRRPDLETPPPRYEQRSPLSTGLPQTPATSRAFFIAVAIAIVGGWFVNALIVSAQTTTLDRTRERLGLAEQHLDKGRLKAANSLLMQVPLDLDTVDRFYTLPSIDRLRLELVDRHRVGAARLRREVAALHDFVQGLPSLVEQGQLAKAPALVETAFPDGSPDDVVRAGLSAYLDRMRVQDFKGADDAVTGVMNELPDELTVREIGAMLSGLVDADRKANREAQARIAALVKGTVDLNGVRGSAGFRPLLRGRAMIWDFTKGAVDQAYELLPDDLRASSREGVVTMFCIVGRRNVEVGRYSISNQPAYQEHMTIGVVYWPQKASPGTAVVLGDSPRSVRPVTYSPEYGSAVRIKEWIAGLPRK
jgi:hypothetical protein